MKKILPKIVIIFLALIILLQTLSFATFRPGEINGNVSVANSGELTSFANRILGFIDVGGTLLAIVVIIIIGIQYMKASGEQKAQYKEKLFPYVIGCILLFAAPKIAKLVYNVASKI